MQTMSCAPLTINKAINLVEHVERDKRSWRRTSLFSELDFDDPRSGAAALTTVFRSRQPDPAFTALVVDRLQWLLRQLKDDQLREIALLKLEGRTNPEIAIQLSCALSTVERRVRLIRLRLEHHLCEPVECSVVASGVRGGPPIETTGGPSWVQPS
jgi:DNA-directed RNA polymerase specialized sigma24 family protein